MWHWPERQSEGDRQKAAVLDALAAQEAPRLKSEAEVGRLATYRALDEEEEQIRLEISTRSGLLETATAKEKHAEQEYKAAAESLEAARFAREKEHFELFELRGKLDTIRASRRMAAPEIISKFQSEMWKRFDEIRLKGSGEERRHKQRVTGIMTSFWVSNFSSVDRATKYIRDAVQAAECLKFEALRDEQIESTLAKLWDGIPDVQEFESNASPPILAQQAAKYV